MTIPKKTIVPLPFEQMALSLSGGGYRATAYHLGAMSMLDSVKYKQTTLLEKVKVLSSISGGSITAAMYALKLAQRQGFQETFDRIHKLLSDDELVSLALDKLNNPSSWDNPYKTKDLINAFSEVYNHAFFEGATFKMFEKVDWHLNDLSLGATECTKGLQFRLLKSSELPSFGNGILEIPLDIAATIKIGDAVAASSCFPGGFEPMIMPKDFSQNAESLLSTYWEKKEESKPRYQPTGIMDGGIVDNLGIDSVVNAENRYNNNDKSYPIIGTFIISDVSGKNMPPLDIPELKDASFGNIITANVLNGTAITIVLIAIVILWFSQATWAIAIASILLTISAIWLFCYRFIKRKIIGLVKTKFGQRHVPDILQDLSILRKTPIYLLIYLIKFRVSSVLKMVNDIFLRRIKALNLKLLFSDKIWNYRLFTNDIHKLSDIDDLPQNLKPIIDLANDMPTTLWFSQEEKDKGMLDAIIVCGQVTLCYNMIQYIEKIRKIQVEDPDTAEGKRNAMRISKNLWNLLEEKDRDNIDALYQDLKKKWNHFAKDPEWLLRKKKKQEMLIG